MALCLPLIIKNIFSCLKAENVLAAPLEDFVA